MEIPKLHPNQDISIYIWQAAFSKNAEQRKVRPIWPLGRRILTNKNPKSLVKNGRFQVHGRFFPLTKGPKKYHPPFFMTPTTTGFTAHLFTATSGCPSPPPLVFLVFRPGKGPSCWTYHSPSFTWNLKVMGCPKGISYDLLGTIFR